MDRTNIINIVDELISSTTDAKFNITFLSETKPDINEPSIIITVATENNIRVTFYLTENEANMITFDELNTTLGILVKQEV